MDGEVLIRDQQPSATPAEFAPPPPDASAGANPETEPNKPYPAPASTPTQLGPNAIRFDFNQGARLVLPNRTEAKWRVRLRDLDTGNILFQTENKGAFVSSSKRFFVRFGSRYGSSTTPAPPPGAGPRIRRPRPRRPDPVPGRHAGRHPRLVLLRRAFRRGAWLPPDLRHVRPDHSATARRLPGDPLRHARGTGGTGLPPKHTRPTASACSSTTRTLSISPPISAMSGCTAPPATSWGSIRRRNRRAWRCRTKPGRSRNPTSASPCKARRSANTGTTRTAGAR